MATETEKIKATQSLSQSWGSEMVEVFVGPERRRFVLHKDLLCKASSYFEGMFNGHLAEATSNSCHLQAPEDTPEGFEIFVSWLYKDRLPADYEAVAGSDSAPCALVRFYVLADKLVLAKEVKVQALDRLAKLYLKEGCDFPLWSNTVNYTLRSTAEDCPLRLLVVDMMWDLYTYHPDDNDCHWLRDCLQGIPAEQVAKVIHVIRDPSLFILTPQKGAWGQLREAGKSIADASRYQIGMLKVVKEAERGGSSGSTPK